MPQQDPGSPGSYGAPPRDAGQWSGDGWPQRGPASRPWPPPPPPPPGRRGGGNEARIRPLTAALIAVTALAAAVAVALMLVSGNSTGSPAAAAQGNAPAAGAPVQGGGGGGNLFLGGTVTKISGTSITITAQDHVVTAAITSSTQFTGSVRSASGVRAGDKVMVTISGYGSQDPVCDSLSDQARTP